MHCAPSLFSLSRCLHWFQCLFGILTTGKWWPYGSATRIVSYVQDVFNIIFPWRTNLIFSGAEGYGFYGLFLSLSFFFHLSEVAFCLAQLAGGLQPFSLMKPKHRMLLLLRLQFSSLRPARIISNAGNVLYTLEHPAALLFNHRYYPFQWRSLAYLLLSWYVSLFIPRARTFLGW